jgi:DNA repair exonuclease SbcCD ATPase subunit
MEIQQLRHKLERQKGQKFQIEKSLTALQEQLSEKKRSLRRHEQAREIVREVGMKTQEQLQFHISDITSLALEAVFPDPYELAVEFIQRRNKTECDLYFVREGNKIDPLTASGVGAVDVAAFALRIASWSMLQPRTRNTIILDEPFKHLKGKRENLKVLEMVKELSTRLNLQIIMVSDERIDREDTIAAADRIFEVSIKKGKSKIVEI